MFFLFCFFPCPVKLIERLALFGGYDSLQLLVNNIHRGENYCWLFLDFRKYGTLQNIIITIGTRNSRPGGKLVHYYCCLATIKKNAPHSSFSFYTTQGNVLCVAGPSKVHFFMCSSAFLISHRAGL